MEQDSILDLIEKINDMIAEGKMTAAQFPLDDIKRLLNIVYEYIDMDMEYRSLETLSVLMEENMLQEDTGALFQNMLIFKAIAEDIFKIINQGSYAVTRQTKELVEKCESGEIDYEYIKNHINQVYQPLFDSKDYDTYKKISKTIEEIKINNIRKKDKKRICFLLKDSAEWSCEELYKSLSKNDNYELFIAVTPFAVGTQKSINDTYNATLEYFASRGYKTYGFYDYARNTVMTWNEMGMPDIVIHLNPHHKAFVPEANIVNYPMSILNIYIPYGFLIYGKVDSQFNQESHLLYHRIYCETDMQKMMAKKYSGIGDANVVYGGYCKMDELYLDKEIDENAIWKLPCDGMKKIIYAPHYSMKNGHAAFGNFDKIYKDFYELAKNTKDSISWIIRPHPMTRAQSVVEGVFANEEEYDSYMKQWDDLPNARYSVGGTYMDMFASSDAMILDSISFMSEYLYAHKPLLFLTRDTQTFNDFGKELVEVLYKCDGGNFEGIKDFVHNVVEDEHDDMKDIREEFFDKFMDYKKTNGKLASEFIYDDISSSIGD